MFVKADQTAIDDIIPDVFYKSDEGLFFEDATSVQMENALGVGFYNDWIIIIDINGRFIANPAFPERLSDQFPVKTFWVAEDLIFREYRNGNETKAIAGITQGTAYLSENGINAKDEWGETIIIQILESEIFPEEKAERGWVILCGLKFDKYELD